MTGMRNVLMMVIGVGLLGWLAACSGTQAMMDDDMNAGEDMMTAEADGMLHGSDGHHAAGKVSFGMGMNGGHTLVLSDIKVDKVPDGYVYLTKGADRMHGVQVGMLEQFSGTVSFDLPAGVSPDDYDSVVIWCKKYSVEIGRAYLPEKMM